MAAGRNWKRRSYGLLGALAALCLLLIVGLAPAADAQSLDKLNAAEAKVEALAKAGKTDAAITLGRKLVAAARKSLGKSDANLAVYLAELAKLQASRGRLAEAEKLIREVIAINGQVAGPDSPLMLGSLQALADILIQGKGPQLDEAEVTLARSLAIAEGAFGPGSPEAADVQRRLAAVYERQGRNAEAAQLRVRSEQAQRARADEDRQQAEAAAIAAAGAQTEAEAGKAGASQKGTAEPPPPAAEPPTTVPEGPSASAPQVPEAAPGMTQPEAGQGGASSSESAPTGQAEDKMSAQETGHQRRHIALPEPSAGAARAAKPTAAPPPAEYHVVEVFYGTNRKPFESAARVSFTSNEDDKLSLGAALITVPVTHQVPQVERPWALRIPGTDIELTFETEDPARHFTIKSIETLPEDQFLSRVKDRLGQSQTFKGQALVFVHGFYNTFDDALYRTAQIVYDMQFDGAAFMYSWPSAGTLDAYGTDLAKAKRAGTQLRAFLALVARKSGATRVTVIAHSLGNLPLMEALDETIAPDQPSLDATIDDVVLAAPDIGRAEFVAMAEHMNHVRGGMTLYAASNDLALAASRTVNGEERAGDTRQGGPLLLPHVDTIDATGTSLQLFQLNHNYVAESSAVLCDLEQLLRTGQHPPDARTRLLMPVEDGTGKYYTFRP